MSDGDDEPDDADQDAADAPAEDAEMEEASPQEEAVDYELDVETFEERLDDAEAAIEAAETEADLDEVEHRLETIATDLDRADLPEPDEEDDEAPADALNDRLDTLQDAVADARGPYDEDVVAEIETVQESLRTTRWTETGESELVDAVTAFVDTVDTELATDLEAPSGEAEELADGLDSVASAITDAGLDPDEDAETLAALMEGVETLSGAVEDAEEWDDLTVREQVQAQGFYDALGEKHKEFPPEWTAIKEWENAGNAEMILLALDAFDSDFLERHCLEALERMGPPEAIDEMLGRAERRNRPAIRILGKIGEPRDEVVETLEEYVGTESDPALQKVTMKALGEMGAETTVQTIADQLTADNPSVRSHAARALGLVGDPRAIDPLATILEDDEDDSVRASAAWALTQIGTETALETAAAYADDRAYVVQAEAEPAARALDDQRDAPPA